MTELLREKENAEAIMDDIIIHGKANDDHDLHLKEVFQTVGQSGLKLNKEKCEIGKSKIKFFGRMISGDGIGADPEKVKAIVDLRPPTNVHELKQLLGMVNYLGKFLPNLSTVLQPISELLKTDMTWLWGVKQAEAFQKVKELVTTTPILVFYDPSNQQQ